MPTAVLNIPFHNTTDADFRAWGKACSDGFAAVGMIKTADTGQVDWATVTKPATTTGIGAPYEVYRFNDALQDTAPIFVKIEYGATYAAIRPALYVTISRSTDGAGNPVNVLAPRRQTPGVTGTGSAAIPLSIEPIYISSDSSSLCFSARIGTTSIASVHAPAFVIDRSRDVTGTPTATGGVILTEGSGPIASVTSSGGAQLHAWTYSGESVMTDIPATAPAQVNGGDLNGATSMAHNDRTPVFPYVVVVPGHAPWQVLAACAVIGSDAANGPFTANVLGAVRNYRSIPIGESHSRWMSGSTTGYTGLCILWEE